MKTLSSDDLAAAFDGSYYTISGTGGPLEEWVEGYERLMADKEIGKPVEWFKTTGAAVNTYAARKQGGAIRSQDQFKPDLVLLMFPLTGLFTGPLAMFRIHMQDRWFDDIVQNMRVDNG